MAIKLGDHAIGEGVSLFANAAYKGFLRQKVLVNCNKLRTHLPVLQVSDPSGYLDFDTAWHTHAPGV